MMTGVSRSVRSCLIRRASVNPSTPGIWQSVMTAWKRSLVGLLSASSADAASPTVTGVMCQLASISCEDPAVRRVVVDDEHAEAFERRRPFGQPAPCEAVDRPKTAVKWNVLPWPIDAFDPEAAAHQLDEPARDRQTQAGAAKAASRRSVGLRERLENLVVFLGADADARVRDAELQASRPRRSPRRRPRARPLRPGP